jgi:hypothetical protein
MNTLDLIRFVTVIATAISFGAGLVHVLSLPHKMQLVVFFVVIFPANRVTVNWTTMPANWESLRRRWEYGHVVDTALYLLALSALIVSLLAGRGARAG